MPFIFWLGPERSILIEKELTHIDLFSGIGGFTLAAEWAGFKTVVFCEKEKFCQEVLRKRFGGVIANPTIRGLSKQRLRSQNQQSSQSIKGNRKIPIIPEIRDFDGTKYRGATLLTGGFPCQPFSVAGQRRGKEDDRYLWPEMLQVISEAKPRWILAENVPGIFRMALDTVLADLEGEDYTTGTFIIPACGLNAPHRRNRVWIIANSGCQYGEGTENKGKFKRPIFEEENASLFERPIKNDELGDVADSSSNRGKAGITNSQTWQKGKPAEPNNNNQIAPDSSSRGIQGKSISIRQRQSRQATCNIKRSNQNASNSKGRLSRKQAEQEGRKNSGGGDKDVTDSTRKGLQRFRGECELRESKGEMQIGRDYWNEPWYEIAARFCRVDDGISDRIHRLKALGNAIVPQIAFEILKNIAWIENELAR